MMSCFHIMERMGHNQRRRVCLVLFRSVAAWGRSLPSPTTCCVTDEYRLRDYLYFLLLSEIIEAKFEVSK